METKKKKMRKVVSIFLLTIMLLSALLPTLTVFAEDNVPAPGETNSKTTSMLNLFRELASDIDAGKVSEDEYRVLGVLISNYFIPGQTTVKDIKGDDIAKKLAKSFLGDESKYSILKELTTKLHEGITHSSDGLGSNTEYVLTNKDNSPMTGLEFLDAIASGGTVNLNGKQVMNFNIKSGASDAKAMRGSMQILMGVSPDLFIGTKSKGGFWNNTLGQKKSVGIALMDRLYLDGVGNIWGSYAAENGTLEKDDYVLIMPGCLNPLTFNKNKVPVSNAFAMGAMVNADSIGLNKEDGSIFRPYYNIKSKMGANSDAKNMMNIYGVHSPTNYVGNTDGIIKGDAKMTSEALQNSITQFATATGSSTYDAGKLKIIFSLDMLKYESFEADINKVIKGGEKQKQFVDYFATNIMYAMSEISQDMYFFSNGGGTGIDGVGEFTNNDSLMKKHMMFAEDKGGNKYTFYKNGLTETAFSNFLVKFASPQTTESTKRNLIKNEILGKTGNYTKGDKDVDTVYLFLTKGLVYEGTGSCKSSLVAELTNLLYGGSKPRIYDTVLYGESKSISNMFDIYKKKGFVVGMAHKDTALADLSNGAPTLSIKPKEPFNSAGALGSLSKAGQDAVALLFHTVNTYNIFSIDTSISSALTGSAAGSGLKTPWGDYTIRTKIANEVNNWSGIYWGYTVALLGGGIVDGQMKASGWSNAYLPKLTINTTGTLDYSDALTGGVAPSDDKTIEDMQKDIIRKIYGLLSEDDNSYRTGLIESTLDGFILSTHRALVGSWVGENFVVGTGKTYTSAVGYLSTPSLYDLPFTSWLLEDYGMIYMFSLLLLLMITVVMVITNNRTVQEGLFLFLIMGVVLMLPQSLVVNVVNITNKVTDSIYSEKFNYWAISQHHESLENGLKGSGAEGDMALSMDMNKDFSSSDARVRIKWMAPKKDEEFDKMYKNESKLDGVENNLVLTKFLMNNFINQSEYVIGGSESYLYRPYSQIANSAKNMYLDMGGNATDLSTLKGNIQDGKNMVDNVPTYRFDGLMGNIVDIGDKDLMSKVDTYSVDSEVTDGYKYWGLGNFGVTMSIFRQEYTIEEAGLTSYTDDSEFSSFLLMTESPYYYFYNVFKTRYASVNGGFKNALLESNVFKVSGTDTDADGEIRDFLDMDGLFTNVIPYLKQSNEYVDTWTSIYGREIDTYDFEGGNAGDEYQEQYESAKLKKDALKKVWKMYTPWVDGVYESSGEKELLKGSKIVMVDDPVNPGAYANASNTRRMCFSPAEREARGYNVSMLTDTEMRIQKVLEETYEDMMYLINYYDFNDEVLLSMASMLATFNFNKEFSEYRLFGESTVLYPQNFELKNFNFDAYMRLMIVNATGEPMKSADGDLYERMMAKTSFFTGLLLLVVDVLGVIIIPAIKIVALVLIFVLSVVIGFSCILVPSDKIGKRIIDALFKPMALLMASMVGFAFIMSMFMGEGYTSYVGSKTPTLGVTDPNILMLLVALLSCVYMYLLLKVIGLTWKHLKTNTIATVLGAVATVASLGTVVSKAVGKGGIATTKNGARVAGNIASGTVNAPGNIARGVNNVRHGLYDNVDSLNDAKDRFKDLRGSSGPNIEDSPDYDTSLENDIDNLAKNRGAGGHNIQRGAKEMKEYANSRTTKREQDKYKSRDSHNKQRSNIVSRTINSTVDIIDDHNYANERGRALKDRKNSEKEVKRQRKEEKNN